MSGKPLPKRWLRGLKFAVCVIRICVTVTEADTVEEECMAIGIGIEDEDMDDRTTIHPSQLVQQVATLTLSLFANNLLDIDYLRRKIYPSQNPCKLGEFRDGLLERDLFRRNFHYPCRCLFVNCDSIKLRIL